MSTPVGIIKRLVEGLTTTSDTGTAAVDDALKQFGIDSYSALKSSYSNAYNSRTSGQDFLEQVCGVRRNNTDTGAITGSDAGGSETKTAESIIPENSIAQSLSEDEYNSFTKNGLTVNVTYGGGGSSEGMSERERLVVRGLYNWWIPEALDLINKSLGVNFTDGRAGTNTINVSFSYGAYLSPVAWTVLNDLGRPSTINMRINMYNLQNLTASDQNGTLNDVYAGVDRYCEYLDRYLLNELAAITLRANIGYFYDLPTGVQTGLQYIVGGLDDESSYITNFLGDIESYRATAYTFLRWFAKNYSDGYPGDIICVHNNDDALGNSGADEFIITSSVEAATINTNGGNDLITGRTGADNLTVVQPSDSTDKVTIVGGAGNDMITVGEGYNVISYSVGDGNDTVYGFNASIDEVYLGSDNYSTARSSNDFVVNVGNGSITLKDVGTRDVTINALPNGLTKSGSTITVSSTYNGGVWLTGFDILNRTECYADASAIEVNASGDTRSERVIVGNEQSNVLRAGVNGAWLWGYLGNDTLFGGNGSDMFWVGKDEGWDKIQNCGSEDIVNLWSVNLSEINLFETDGDKIYVGIEGNSGSTELEVNTTGTSTTFQLVDVGRWRYEHNSRSFHYVES